MSVHEDLLNNGENNCSFTEDEVDIMCSKDGDAACGDGSLDVKSEPRQVKKTVNKRLFRELSLKSTIGCWKAFLFMFENCFVGIGPQCRVDTRG